VTRVAVGRITRAHGLKGEVGVVSLSEVPSRFDPGASLAFEDGGVMTVQSVRRGRGRMLVKFEDVDDRTAAERLHGRYLFVDDEALGDLPEGSFWPHQLEGCEVLTEDGRSLGLIAEVILGQANDVWVARAGERETLVPALREFVASVDIAAGRVVVRVVPGLTGPGDAD
jgi:16S rRNA processing protein RimM